jgi:simple sugar transport system permease protein
LVHSSATQLQTLAESSGLADSSKATGGAPSSPRGRIDWAELGPRLEPLLIPLFALLVSLALFGGFVALAGQPPLEVYFQMYRGAFGTWFSFQNTLQRASPLLLTALCTALPARAGLIVIGGEGAFVMGGLAAAATGVGLAESPTSDIHGPM